MTGPAWGEDVLARALVAWLHLRRGKTLSGWTAEHDADGAFGRLVEAAGARRAVIERGIGDSSGDGSAIDGRQDGRIATQRRDPSTKYDEPETSPVTAAVRDSGSSR